MRYLLDTHIAIWLLHGDDGLPREVLRIAESTEHELYLSAASTWEVVIKHQKSPHKMELTGETLVYYCNKADIKILPILPEHVLTVATLRRPNTSTPHNDPFDRLLIAQSKHESMIFLTHDSLLAEYSEPTVRYV